MLRNMEYGLNTLLSKREAPSLQCLCVVPQSYSIQHVRKRKWRETCSVFSFLLLSTEFGNLLKTLFKFAALNFINSLSRFHLFTSFPSHLPLLL